MAAAAGLEADHRPYRLRILTGKCDGAPTSTRLTDDDDVITLDERLGRHVIDDPHVERRNRQSSISEIGVRTVAHAREEKPEQATLGNFDSRGTVSRAHGRDYHVTLLCEPKCCIAELDDGKVASLLWVERNSMVHHQKRKWSIPGGTDHVGQHRND